MTQLVSGRTTFAAARFWRSLVCRPRFLLSLLTALVLLPATALADTASGNSEPVQKTNRGLADSSVAIHNGAFTSQIDIELPAYRKNTPQLSVVYNSTGGNGFAGVGWELQGFSQIERVAPGRGSPRTGGDESDDTFLLDGEELVPLGSSMYATKRQRFLRIKDTGANWEVRRPDGTILTYEMIYAAAGKTLRWGLKRIASPGDRNPVTYVWWCDPAAIYESKSPECYPSQINYANGRYVVNLFRESRTDKETFATGYLLGVRQYRLRSIQVVVAGSQLRAYQLVYTYSSRTQRSLLKSVRQYGSDDVTSLPATTIRWQNSEQASGFTIAAQLSGYYGLTLDQWQNSDLYNADFNGDGRTDLLLVYKWASTYAQTQAYLLLAKPGGGFQTVRNITNLYGMSQARWFNVIRPAIADFSGDGRADIQFSYTNDVGAASAGLLTSTPDGDDGHLFASFVDATTKFGMTGTAWNRNYTTVMDYNGDGRADLLVPGTNGQGFAVMRMLAGNKDTTFATAFDFTSEGQMSAGLWQSTSVHAGDFNGDGRSDLLLSHYTGTGFSLYLLTAQEDGHYTRSDITSKLGLTSPDWEGSAWHIADYNGDGRADLLLRRYSTTNDSHLLLATGSDGIDRGGQAGFQAVINVTNLYGMSRSYWGNSEITTGDYNGDVNRPGFSRHSAAQTV